MVEDEKFAVNSLRALCADIVEKAKSGHPGAPLGLAPTAFVLFTKILKYNPNNPDWCDRDRFLLSNGHACALQYALLNLTGYDFWTSDVLKNFRQLDSPSAGHPECHFPGIEVTTGPLGQGIANAVGLALAEKHLASTFNKDDIKIVDHYTYVMCGDGCLQEGIASEAASLAGHLGLGKLIVLYDDNHITIDGGTDLSFTEDVLKRHEAYGWHTESVLDGDNDTKAIEEALNRAKAIKDKPSLIKITTTIGYGSKKQGSESVHGAPLGAEDIKNLKNKFSLDPDSSFNISERLKSLYDHKQVGMKCESEWNALFDSYKAKYPDLAAEFHRRRNGEILSNWENIITKKYSNDASISTRKVSGDILNTLANYLPEIIGGSADLCPSTFTYLKNYDAFSKSNSNGRNIHFGVREHSMAGILNGVHAHGFYIPFCSTFLNFIGYAFGSVTLSALSGHQVLYIFTHDSIGVGEDGPTHQPIEKFMFCRNTPNLLFIRPADENETIGSYIAAVRNTTGPTVFALSRQNLPKIDGTSIENVLKGAYTLRSPSNPANHKIVIVSTGSELQIAIDAYKSLSEDTSVNFGVSVVSFPSWELFEKQDLDYKLSVFPPGVAVLSVEAGIKDGWEKYAHASVGMKGFGASGPASQLYKRFGITTDNVIDKAKLLVSFYRENPAQSLLKKPF